MIQWDNEFNKEAWLKDSNTIVVMHGDKAFEF